MKFDLYSQQFNSKRNVIIARNGMVATSNPLAAQIGLDILKKGGNAIDAAVSTAIALTVLEPTSNGIGGDNFAIIFFKNKLYGLNSSGYTPKKIDISKIRSKNYNRINPLLWESVTVPGAVKGWYALASKFGKFDFKDLFLPAIEYAKNGFPIYPTIGYYWNLSTNKYKSLFDRNYFYNYTKNFKSYNYNYQDSANHIFHDKSNNYFKSSLILNKEKENLKEEFEIFKSTHIHWFKTFTKNGKSPEIGSTFRLKDHAKTLQSIARTNTDAFYKGELTEKIIEFSNKNSGFFTYDDFKNYQPRWIDPYFINYRGYKIYELPPNTQGIATLLALGIISNFKFTGYETPKNIHQTIEAMKIAFKLSKKHICDPSFTSFNFINLLKSDFLKKLSSSIDVNKTIDFVSPEHIDGGTVYLATADKEGNMVSFIQSNYMGFGSGIVIPSTGIALHNRAANFSLHPSHPNCIAPLKRPYHTIIPGFIIKKNTPIGPFGVMGGFMQPQGHLQVVSNLIDYNLNPQEALDKPRWQWTFNNDILVEDDFDRNSLYNLQKKGHNIVIKNSAGLFGRGQIIILNKNGLYIGGTEKRCDGYIAIY